MTILRTDKDTLTPDDIIKYIKDYEEGVVPPFDKLWDYYLGKNPTILEKRVDPGNPSNKTPVSYGRKIITTFTGYAYRPRYITYKSDNYIKIMFKLAKVYKHKTVIYGTAWGAAKIGCDCSPVELADCILKMANALALKNKLAYRHIPWSFDFINQNPSESAR